MHGGQCRDISTGVQDVNRISEGHNGNSDHLRRHFLSTCFVSILGLEQVRQGWEMAFLPMKDSQTGGGTRPSLPESGETLQ